MAETPTLVAVAHGSRDPRSARTVAELVDLVRFVRPDLDVRTSFLDLSTPRLTKVLAATHADGQRTAVVVPLLLGRAYHARVDIPGVIARFARHRPGLDVRAADVLGPDARLEAVALDRLRAVGADPADRRIGVLLAGTGASGPSANAAVHTLARRWSRRTSWAGVVAGFATAEPDVPAAIARLRIRGARRIAVGMWFLAPGLLPDRVSRQVRSLAPDGLIAEPLGPDERLAELVLDRYAEAVSAALPAAS
ncbi:MAG TPA: sirohydrochlorin chelatase [Pseudonocardiaceae bacterium]|nr:sirohydrochlorin chelatase [Pseudonocardiaceae bacterium]